ncbi:DUF3325 domain-containing protein [Lampropedia aestuarii]|uniref:DUF3325 domain-containing protein n=1 Tax=Lampropedia aestuarii TaxID=2562762 RepID=UPI0024698B4C|nr:DUF3325 domain-containing protein [Lampropedia aestuarii]MDH5855751.1 DUF3325 domain-containing protein [Lampropedia aestuarii]
MNALASWAHALMGLSAWAGFICLALAMERHQNDLWARSFSQGANWLLRAIGWGLLVLGLVVAVQAKGWGFGLALFSGHTSAAAGLVVVALLLINRYHERARQKA